MVRVNYGRPKSYLLDRRRKGGAVLVRRAARFEEGAVDPLDVNAAVLHRLDRVGDLDQLAGGGVGVNEVVGFDEFHGLGIA
jgi:hypothetical protein